MWHSNRTVGRSPMVLRLCYFSSRNTPSSVPLQQQQHDATGIQAQKKGDRLKEAIEVHPYRRTQNIPNETCG